MRGHHKPATNYVTPIHVSTNERTAALDRRKSAPSQPSTASSEHGVGSSQLRSTQTSPAASQIRARQHQSTRQQCKIITSHNEKTEATSSRSPIPLSEQELVPQQIPNQQKLNVQKWQDMVNTASSQRHVEAMPRQIEAAPAAKLRSNCKQHLLIPHDQGHRSRQWPRTCMFPLCNFTKWEVVFRTSHFAILQSGKWSTPRGTSTTSHIVILQSGKS